MIRLRLAHKSIAALMLAAALAGSEVRATEQARAAAEPALRILVVAGEDAVNVVQQKTATAPVIEVRDKNNQPVVGAFVRFAITKGRATLAAGRTLTVATDAAGRAIVTGLTPTGAGAINISATAAFQGQTAAAVTIAQTNVMTAAEAAALSGSGAAGGASGASAGGAAAGGGLSTTATTAIVAVSAAGAAGGAVLATSGDSSPKSLDYSGPFSSVLTLTTVGGCSSTSTLTGTLRMKLTIASDGVVTGTATLSNGKTFDDPTLCFGGQPAHVRELGWGAPDDAGVTGTASAIEFIHSATFTNGSQAIWQFAGSRSDTAITGVLTHTSINPGFQTGVVQFAVTLR